MATLKNTLVNDTGFITLPAGTFAQRPGTPSAGMIRFNTESNTTEYYNSSGEWVNSVNPSIEYVTSLENTSSLTTYTFTNANIGGPGLIVVSYHQERTSSTPFAFSSGTIGGSEATSAVTRAQSGTTSTTTGLMYRRITSGTTATVTVTFLGAPARCRIGIWRILNTMSDTPTQTENNGASSGTGLSLTLNSLSAKSVGIASQTNGVQGTTITWTNANRDYSLNIGSGTTTYTSGASFITVSSGNRTISSSHASSNQAISAVAAAWF
jgi:hypothetical protein